MRKIQRLVAVLSTLALIVMASRVWSQGGSPVPGQRIHGQVEGGYFIESELYRYLADVNLWFDFGQYKDLVFFFNSGILTYISDTEDKNFQPERYRGTLQPGTYLVRGKSIYYFYIKHQSFHDIDMYDGIDESYEIYTLAYKHSGFPDVFISAGKFLNTEDVDYDLEYIAYLEFSDIARFGNRPVYLAGSARRVQESGNPTGRDGFTDYTAELGIQTTPGLRYFLGYRKIHDINRFNGVTDKQVLVGLRYNW